MKMKMLPLSVLLIVFLLSISCGGKNEANQSKRVSETGSLTIKIAENKWFFNNQGLSKAIEKAKQSDKLVFAVFSSKW